MIQNGVCCFTGHRTYESSVTPMEREFFEKLVDNLINYGYTTFIAGGALGFDTAAAEYILKKRVLGAHIRLVLILPCADQASRWSFAQRRRYEGVKQAADKVICLHDSYVDGCMQERNRMMVEKSTACIAYCTEDQGGTAGTLRYAMQRGIDVYNVPEIVKKMG